MDPIETPFTLYPSRVKTSLYLLVSLMFATGGFFMIRDNEPKGWFVSLFFGLCFLVFLAQMLPGCTHLTVDDEGIEICSLFRKSRIAWRDIAQIGVYSLRNHGIRVTKMVGINYSPSYTKARTGRATAKALSGFEGALPDTYGLKAEDLALLLQYYRGKAESKTQNG